MVEAEEILSPEIRELKIIIPPTGTEILCRPQGKTIIIAIEEIKAKIEAEAIGGTVRTTTTDRGIMAEIGVILNKL